ncbi:polysaccharide lyase 8 family protein [Formosa sp. PL04]|uniref:polysaccharide lyase 8 family protein n=1 Tax=Formosa sp. PL04 TaxID=3081755 RepID=UPI00298119F3|nr:polysaccharide lyase 8 family protein [Formosa sp. PL04]MDW5288118.1 polysaccharide lyase 8 family protein [Formosa sp. PL04]
MTNFPKFSLRNIFKSILVLLIICSTFSCDKSHTKSGKQVVTYPENLQTLHQNIIDYYLSFPVDTVQVENLQLRLQDDGAWPTLIDYTNTARGNWPVKEHLEHVQTLAKAYQTKESKFYHDANLSAQIQKSLNYWLEHDFLSTNWWDQHIGVPELLAPTLFLMEDELSQQQIEQSLVLLRRAKIKMTGQNKVWLSGNVLMRSLLSRDIDSVAIASKAIQDELKIANGVGIKADYSYHEHGAQLQFGNYGLSYLEDMIKWFSIVNNTDYQFHKNKIEVLRNFVLEGQQWVIFKEKMDVNASGRQIFKDEPESKYLRLKACIEKMEAIDSNDTEAYKNAMNSEVLTGDKHFWESDFHVHRRPDFYFSVKMSSERVIGTESVNKENIQGYYLGDGATLLYANGDEYNNVFPFWNWKKVPGTTVIQDTSALPIIKAWDFKTNGVFVGGVTNGEDGVSVMDYDRDGLKAHKSWFMFGDKIVCLGSSIQANTNFPVATTINQVFLKPDLMVSQNEKISGQLEKNQSLSPDWIMHDGTGYLFPEGGKVNIETRFLEGSWNKVAKRYRPEILTESILRMWFNHGENPKDENYSYVLVPHATKDDMLDLHKNNPFEILNLKRQQSVVNTKENLAGVVFYEPGNSKIFGGVSVDKPCVILLKKLDVGLEVSVSDPTHKIKAINLIFNGNYQGEFATNQQNKTVVSLQFPQNNQAGKSTTFLLRNK